MVGHMGMIDRHPLLAPVAWLLSAAFLGLAPGTAHARTNLALDRPVELDPAPNYPACTDAGDRKQLTDGIRASSWMGRPLWLQPGTVGWKASSPVRITIDLGRVADVGGVSFSTAAGSGGVAWPTAIEVLFGEDGKSFRHAGELVELSARNALPPQTGYAEHRFSSASLSGRARFVQLLVEPRPEYYTFVDEIEVLAAERPTADAPRGAIRDSRRFFAERVLGRFGQRRFETDLATARRTVAQAGLAAATRGALERRLAQLVSRSAVAADPSRFRAELPLDDRHAEVWAVVGAARKAAGHPALVAWVGGPYDPIEPTTAPPRTGGEVAVALLPGEWRPAVVNLTSSIDRSAETVVSIEGLPGGSNPSWVAVHEVAWTDSAHGAAVASALPVAIRVAGGHRIRVPAGATRQIWLSFHPGDLAPGPYRGEVRVRSELGSPLVVPIVLQILPGRFPARPTLHAGGWDYATDHVYASTSGNEAALIALLRSHFIDTAWATSAVLGLGPFDGAGRLSAPPDTARFDRWIAAWPDARRYAIYLNAADGLPGVAAGTAGFRARVAAWIDFWVAHAKRRGIEPSQLLLLPVDEVRTPEQDARFLVWASAIRAAQPNVGILMIPLHDRPEAVNRDALALATVVTANRWKVGSSPSAWGFYRKRSASLELYSAEGPMLELDPYALIRLQAWEAWRLGARGSSFWSFSDAGGASSWNPCGQQALSYTSLFLSPDSAVSGKHLEALRESIEDYEYFVMLRAALNAAPADHPALARARTLLDLGADRVLGAEGAANKRWAQPKDRTVADAVRLEIAGVISALGSPASSKGPSSGR